MAAYTHHQRGIIRRYYENRDSLAMQNLGELASELYLAETDRERDRLWKRVATALAKLKLPAAQVDRVLETRDPARLAKLLGDAF